MQTLRGRFPRSQKQFKRSCRGFARIMSEVSETSLRSTFSTDKIAFYSFLLLVFSLGFMQPSVYLFKNIEPPSDFIFLVTGCLWLVALLFRKVTFRWHAFYWLLIFYFASMVVSTVFSI